MLIDWFTVCAQIVNFLVLIWLLQRYLYRPILKAIDQREQQIKDEVESARKKNEQAEEQLKELHRQQSELEAARQTMLDEATAVAEGYSKKLMEQSEAEVEEQRNLALGALREERKSLDFELARRAGHEVLNVARKTLADLADDELEKRIVVAFVQRIRSLDEESRNAISTALTESGQPAVVSSTFEIGPAERKDILAALAAELGVPAPEFKPDETLLAGIEVSAGGFVVSWSIDEYLRQLEAQVLAVIDDRPSAAPAEVTAA